LRYAAFFCCAFTFAHLARWNAAIFLRAAADIVRLGFTATAPFVEALFAHRAFCARLIFRRAEADMLTSVISMSRVRMEVQFALHGRYRIAFEAG
jgi:hypothetical protein